MNHGRARGSGLAVCFTSAFLEDWRGTDGGRLPPAPTPRPILAVGHCERRGGGLRGCCVPLPPSHSAALVPTASRLLIPGGVALEVVDLEPPAGGGWGLPKGAR